MPARPLISAFIITLPLWASAAHAQSSQRDSSRAALPAVGIPSFALFARGDGGGPSSAHWPCVGVCARPAAVSVLGVADAPPALIVASRGEDDFTAPAAKAGRVGDDAPPARAGSRVDGGGRRVVTDGLAIAEDPLFTITDTDTDTGGEDSETADGVAGGDGLAGVPGNGNGRGLMPALLATAAAGAGVIIMSSRDDDDRALPVTSSAEGLRNPMRPTLSMQGPAMRPIPAGQVTRTVPEPGTLALLATGLAALGLRRQRGH